MCGISLRDTIHGRMGRGPMDHSMTTVELRASLEAIAYDLALISRPEAEDLFARIGGEAFERVGHSPVAMLADLDDGELELALGDRQLVADVAQLASARRAAEHGGTWWESRHGGSDMLVAYFCMEFGVHDCLPLYSGGLGVLAGDHLKSASTLGTPLVAVGLFYRHGYFRQSVDAEAGQRESYPVNDPERLPLTLERRADGDVLLVEVELDGETVDAQIWRADVGRTRLYLLDSDVDGSSERGRGTTDALYSGDREHRLRQELLLAIGGIRALAALGLRPSVFHVNEGHAALLMLERLRMFVEEDGLEPAEALERIRRSTVFTTHTPVPAGNEVFDRDLVARYVRDHARRAGLSTDELLVLGSREGGEPGFGMTELALRTSSHANAVSALHGRVAREMWADLWPERSPDEVPIGHVTNAVDAPTWISGDLDGALHKAGVWPGAPPAEADWARAAGVSGRELWEIHFRRKAALLSALPLQLDAEALTIGFARRFASYKRAGLVFSDRERLLRLVGDPAQPVQIVLGGKSHPADAEGKAVLAEVVRLSEDPDFAGRVAFVEDYRIGLARLLVQGVDVWLTTPRRPNEASGTSGMKAGLNGVLNLSVLDGWWAEAYDPAIGWAIPEHISAQGDAAEAAELLRLLEEEVVPCYYERDENGLPRRWIEMMQASIVAVGERFSAERMLVEYIERLYLPAHEAAAPSSR